DAAATELVPVYDEVVLRRNRLPRVRLEKLRILRGQRAGKWVMREGPCAFRCAFEHREPVDPHHVVRRRVDQPELRTELPSDLADGATGDAVLAGDREHEG